MEPILATCGRLMTIAEVRHLRSAKNIVMRGLAAGARQTMPSENTLPSLRVLCQV